MRGPFARYQAARSDSPPPVGFAIASRHFRYGPQAGPIRRDLLNRTCGDFLPAAGWFREHTQASYYLMASGDPDPIRIHFPVPDGLYQLSVAMMGSARIRIAGMDSAVVLRGGPFESERYRDCGEVSVGPVVVTGNRFDCRLEPGAADDCLLVRHIGFRPVSGDEPPHRIDPKRLRQLRSLGYVH
jgi:hypothetical protein